MMLMLSTTNPSMASSALPFRRCSGPIENLGHSPIRSTPQLYGASFAVLSGCAAATATQNAHRRLGCRVMRRRAQSSEVAAESAFDPTVQIGAMAPLGYFDPVGLCNDTTEDRFKYLRAAELKHGRVAMLASLGLVAQHDVRFAGYSDVPSGIWALQQAPGLYGATALFLLCGVLELQVWAQNPNDEPGNFGDPLGLGMYDDDMRNKELANGRFAMVATAGIIAAELVTGQDAVEQLSRLQF
mmetsp:Transcript_69007/g.128900  ORF Transcript_69007/g.128900 Transcript_69007/m.128900 type:complete len:242 (+) Transcript_69007:62-787(+)